MKVAKSIEIATPPEKVWPFLAEPEKVLEWYLPLQRFEYSGEQRGVGAPLRFEEKTTGQLMKLDCVVTESVENERFAFRMVSGNMMKSYEERWALEAAPSGTRFNYLFQGEMPFGILGKIISPLAQRSSAATAGKMLAKLKSLAEA